MSQKAFISFIFSLALHLFILFLIVFNFVKEDRENTGLNLKQGEKFESIMITSNLPIGELKKMSIDQKKSMENNKESKAQNKKAEKKSKQKVQSSKISSIENTKKKAILKSCNKMSKKDKEKSKTTAKSTKNSPTKDKENSKAQKKSPSANAKVNSKANNTSSSAPIKGDGKKTSTLVSGNAKKQVKSYQASLMAHLLKFKNYPKQALIKNQEGLVGVKITINSKGEVIASSFKKASKYDILNNAALELFKKASPLPVPPKKIMGSKQNLSFSLPVVYNIREYLKSRR